MSLTPTTKPRRTWLAVLGLLLIVSIAAGVYGWVKFFREVPQPAWITDDPEMRFKYGSIGAEADAGIPYWIFYVLPRVFPEKLPGPGGYASFGVAWEQGMELPVGFTKKTIGFDRVANTCAVCHTATYRASVDSNPVFVPTGPNHTLDLAAFFRFLIDCAKDPRFDPDVLMREINLVTDLSWDDALIYRYLLIPITKKRLLERQTQFAWLYHSAFPDWGRGRDDSMNLTKYFMIEWPMDETFGPTDMPSVWNLGKYQADKGHRMNFAGDSHNAYSVVIDSALGLLGAPPKDNAEFLKQIDWMLDYLKAARAPAYPFAIDTALAEQGKAVFDATCAGCHASERTGTVVPVEEVGTSRDRMDTWNEKAAYEANKVVTDMGIEREGLVEEPLRGYVAAFLDGIWLRAPYLHNGSVPTLRDLLAPPADRPVTFWRGYNLYDRERVGYVTAGEDAEYYGSLHDTRLKGGGNQGHDYGTTLDTVEKKALLEYLKTL